MKFKDWYEAEWCRHRDESKATAAEVRLMKQVAAIAVPALTGLLIAILART